MYVSAPHNKLIHATREAQAHRQQVRSWQLTYVIVQLLQHCFINLDDKGAAVSVLKHCKFSAGPLSCHFVQGHFDAALLASNFGHL